MKNFLLLFLCSCMCFKVNAGIKVLGNSSKYEFSDQLVVADNGNTFSLTLDFKAAGVRIDMFDPERKKIKSEILPISLIKKYTWFSGLTAFSVKNKIILFAVGIGEKKPVLVRLVVDANDGKVNEEKIVGTLPYVNATRKYLIPNGGLDARTDFYIQKDDQSDCYAVAVLNGAADNESERVEIIHYNNNNDEINRSFFITPKESFTFLAYLDLAVNGDKEVNLLLCGIKRSRLTNTVYEKGVHTLLMLHMEAGTKGAVYPIDFQFDREIYGGLIRKNNITNSYVVVCLNYLFKGPTLTSSLITFKIAENATHVSDLHWQILSQNNHMQGEFKTIATPQEIFFGKDGSFRVYSENIEDKESSLMRPGVNNVYVRTMMGNITIADFADQNAKPILSTIPKQYLHIGKIMPKHVQANHANRNVVMSSEGGQKTFFLLKQNGMEYVLINQSSGNGTVKDIDGAGTIVLQVNQASSLSPATTLPLGSRQKQVSYLSLADYNSKCNVLVVPQYDNETKTTILTWMQLDAE